MNFLGGKVQLLPGDCREVLATLPDASVDAVCTDPPYGLLFMARAWDSPDGAPFAVEFWQQVLRVLKPGGHVVAFGGTRMYHRLVVAIEDAGFEIRDAIMWHYGSGFPKSHNVSVAIDKAAGAEREVLGATQYAGRNGRPINPNGYDLGRMNDDAWQSKTERVTTAPATAAARQWAGWGTALKPSTEIICLARKPLIGTVAANVIAHGTGALNIDGTRIATDELTPRNNANTATIYEKGFEGAPLTINPSPLGRWPANLLHDGSEEVVGLFPDVHGAGAAREGSSNPVQERYQHESCYGAFVKDTGRMHRFGDNGSAARFFYTSKADAEDRLGSTHPTVKPVDLMQWLCRLVCPKGGTVLDPFAGTGTTGEAAWREGMRAILIEREPEYQADIARRMDLATQPTKRAAVAATKNKLDDPNTLPLFAGATE